MTTPAELRLKIYCHLFPEILVYQVDAHNCFDMSTAFWEYEVGGPTEPPFDPIWNCKACNTRLFSLLFVAKLIHNELKPVIDSASSTVVKNSRPLGFSEFNSTVSWFRDRVQELVVTGDTKFACFGADNIEVGGLDFANLPKLRTMWNNAYMLNTDFDFLSQQRFEFPVRMSTWASDCLLSRDGTYPDRDYRILNTWLASAEYSVQ